MRSVLNSIKKMLGLEADYKVFDSQIIVHINSAFMTLNQLGVGPPNGFRLQNEEQTWDEFITDDQNIDLNAVEEYVYVKVRIIFDPPASSFVLETLKQMAKELEWRLNVQVECASVSEDVDPEDPSSSGVNDYNNLINKPQLNGTTLQGNTEIDFADKEYVDKKVGDIEYGHY